MKITDQEEVKIEFWDKEDAEYLTRESKDEAIEYILDGQFPDLPKEIMVIGYAKQKAKLKDFDRENILQNLYENLDEDYGSPDGEFCTPNQAVEDALEEFLKILIANYSAYSCEEVTREVINVKEWVAQNCPGWIEDGATFEEDLNP